jgi:hypothetical protein
MKVSVGIILALVALISILAISLRGSAPAVAFLLIVPSTVVSGTPFDVTVAVDRFGHMDTNYQGTVTFSTSDTDPGVTLPANYTFTAGDGGDNGMHSFFSGITLATLGDQTVTVTDTISGITSSITITVTPPG